MQSAARYIGLVVRAFDLRLEIAGSIPAAALSSAYSHIQGGPKSKPLYQVIKMVLNRIKAGQ